MASFPAENLQDWRGKAVIGAEGSKVGQLTAIYFDTNIDEPAFASVKIGMPGRHRLAFVPLAGAKVSPDHVRVAYRKKQINDGPTIETDGELTAADEQEVLSYYGIESAGGEARRLGRR